MSTFRPGGLVQKRNFISMDFELHNEYGWNCVAIQPYALTAFMPNIRLLMCCTREHSCG